MAENDRKRGTAPVIKPLRYVGPSSSPRPISQAEADRWRRKDLWNREEAAFLLCGCVPDRDVSARNVRELSGAIEEIERAWRAGNLAAVNPRGEMRPTDVITWADPVRFPRFPFGLPRDAAPDAETGPGNGDPEIVLPAGKRLVPVADIPRRIAEALYPLARDAEEMTVSYLQKATSRHPHGEWLTDEDKDLLNRTIWPHLPAYRDGITATEWALYKAAFESAESPPAWTLLPAWKNPATVNPFARATAEEQHAAMLKAAIRKRQFVPVTHAGMPLPDVFAAHAYATVLALQRYCEGLPIPVRIRVAERPASGANEEPRQTEPVKAASRPEEGDAAIPHRRPWKDSLTPVIETVAASIEAEGGTADAATVYPKLQAMADAGSEPFQKKASERGLHWRTAKGTPKVLDKNALRDRLARRAARGNTRQRTR